jgi:hypothetical protein
MILIRAVLRKQPTWTRPRGGGGARAVLVVALTLFACVRPALADPTQEAREAEGRAAFKHGNYDEALATFSRLYVETNEPIHLRNIGRCYQELRVPDRAIDSFREYLRRGKNLAPSERDSINAFIREMQALKAQPTTAARTSPEVIPPGPVVEAARPLPPAAPSAAPAPGSSPAVDIVASAPSDGAAPASAAPIYTRLWFWTGIGGVVLIGTVTAVALGSRATTYRYPACPLTAACPAPTY